MDDFCYRGGQLYCGGVNVDELATTVGTPLYLYSQHTLQDHYDRFANAFSALQPMICYSIKSCGNIHLLRLLVAQGAGMDVVSGGELYRAQAAGTPMDKVVYAGVGKTDAEIREALTARIGWFNIESEEEFENVRAIARELELTTRAALRVNPDISDPRTPLKTTTGKKETKFGVDIDRARRFFPLYGHDQNVQLCALHLHLGSPIYSPEPYVLAIQKTMALIHELRRDGYSITTLDIGGGFPATYDGDEIPTWDEYAATITPLLESFVAEGGQVIIEPGRTISANSGVLLTRVQYIKHSGRKKFVVVDTGMSHLIRSTLYDAYHFIWPTHVSSAHVPTSRGQSQPGAGLEPCDIVGPICESSDYLAKDRALPDVSRGDLLCIFGAGAYGMVMASQYNAIPRPPEVLVDGSHVTIVRERETYHDLLAHELKPRSVDLSAGPVGVRSGDRIGERSKHM